MMAFRDMVKMNPNEVAPCGLPNVLQRICLWMSTLACLYTHFGHGLLCPEVTDLEHCRNNMASFARLSSRSEVRET